MIILAVSDEGQAISHGLDLNSHSIVPIDLGYSGCTCKKQNSLNSEESFFIIICKEM